jgi:hypothetical protein
MPRCINDQPGPLPGEGGEELPPGVAAFVDMYGNVLDWNPSNPPTVTIDRKQLQASVSGSSVPTEFRVEIIGGRLVVTVSMDVTGSSDLVIARADLDLRPGLVFDTSGAA